jgi:predicted nucleotide-binding protein (sugar kinase/HSP70/actin superfamily)
MNYIEELSNLLQHTGKHVKVVTINGERYEWELSSISIKFSPAKPIAVPLGSEVIMRVINKLKYEAVTVHLHGVDKRYLWYTDGVAFVQQCPISPGSR